MRTLTHLFVLLIFASSMMAQTTAEWPQLLRDPARTARTEASISPPFRAKWFWLGPDLTLLNEAANAAWTDDLESREGYSFPVPDTYPVTLARGVQPVVSGGRMFVGTMQGTVHGIDVEDGRTLWSYDMGDPVITTACADTDRVLFVDVYGDVVALHAESGAVDWQLTADRSITTAPLLTGGLVYLASHSGRVCVGLAEWGGGVGAPLLAPIQGQMAAAHQRLFVPAENMIVYSLDLQSGDLLAQKQVVGQSFRLTHPVVFGDKLWVTTCMIPNVGSEGIFDDVLDMSGSLEEEEKLTRQFLRAKVALMERHLTGSICLHWIR
ncbi:MAG: PQQ-like beta-propeller repeat protein [Saprospiraceae bacterium]|nr:PQQ-like beta-propeller repeat protein [Candidatus Opimibacter skivensis]